MKANEHVEKEKKNKGKEEVTMKDKKHSKTVI